MANFSHKMNVSCDLTELDLQNDQNTPLARIQSKEKLNGLEMMEPETEQLYSQSLQKLSKIQSNAKLAAKSLHRRVLITNMINNIEGDKNNSTPNESVTVEHKINPWQPQQPPNDLCKEWFLRNEKIYTQLKASKRTTQDVMAEIDQNVAQQKELNKEYEKLKQWSGKKLSKQDRKRTAKRICIAMTEINKKLMELRKKSTQLHQEFADLQQAKFKEFRSKYNSKNPA